MELVFFILVTFSIAIAGGIAYLIYIPFKLWLLRSGKMSTARSRLINKIYIYLLFVIVLGITYAGIFPDESFYADEFKDVTLRELPKSAEFVSKSALYPDFHGEYCSQSEIKLSKKDYSKLLWELHKDDRLTKGGEILNISGSHAKETLTYQFIRTAKDKSGKYLYIGFGKDNRTIYIDACQL